MQKTSYTIAIVEDDKLIREISHTMLTQHGHMATLCDSAWQIINLCVEQGRHFEIIVLDILMLGLSGLEVPPALKAVSHARDTRFVFVSALPAALERAEITFGESAVYLAKPFSQEELLAAVEMAHAKLG